MQYLHVLGLGHMVNARGSREVDSATVGREELGREIGRTVLLNLVA